MTSFQKILIAIGIGFGATELFAKPTPPANTPVEPTASKPNNTPSNTTANTSLILKKGSKGYEVKLLQAKLGFVGSNVDGIFGSGTEAALIAATGLNSTTLAKFDAEKAAFTSKNQTTANINAVKTNFPINKSVLAKIKFRAYVCVFRNGDWYTTDNNGIALPSKEFLATAIVGKVYSYGYANPELIIIDTGADIIGYDSKASYSTIPANQNFRKVLVKASWVK